MAALVAGTIGANAQMAWNVQNSMFTAASRGINDFSVVDSNTVWAVAYDGSGTNATIRDIAKTMMAWYEVPALEREECGIAGRDWAVSDEAGLTAERMCDRFAQATTKVLDNWVAPKRFKMYNIKSERSKLTTRKNGITLSYE